jgi:hypothetical protein
MKLMVDHEEGQKDFWHNRWKKGASWLEMANTLIKAAYNTRDFGEANTERFIKTWAAKGLRQSVRRELTCLPDGWDLYPVYMLLAGYALENLFKGIIISGMWLDDDNSVDSIDDFENLSAPLKGSTTQTMTIKKHGLIDLLAAKNMSLTFGKEEKEVMQKLNDFVLWGGRYPSPKNYKTNFQQIPPSLNEPNEQEIIYKMYHKAAAELDRLSNQQIEQQGGHSTGRIFSSPYKLFDE